MIRLKDFLSDMEFPGLKKKPMLYKAVVKKRKLAMAEQAKAIQNKTPQGNDTGTVKKIRYRGRAQICVMSMEHGGGATYLSEILALFFAGYRNGKTCLVETKGLTEMLSDMPMDVVTYPCDMSQVYKGDYHFIVRDMGVYHSLSLDDFKEIERADFKCIVSWPDERSLSALASFVETTECADSFIYFFNMVPKDRMGEILDLMRDYNTIILPCTSLDNLDGNLVKKLFSVFGKG